MSAQRRVWVMAKGYAPDEGGMQTYAAGVAQAYRALGWDVTVFTQTSAGPRTPILDGVKLIDIGPGKSPRTAWAWAQALRGAIRCAGPPEFVHGTTWRTSAIPLALGLRCVTTFHGREFAMPKGPVAAAMRWVARRAIRTVAVSGYSAARLVELIDLPQSPLVAWNGPSFATLAKADASIVALWPGSEGPLLLSLCRLEPRKNIGAAIAACAILRDQGQPFRFLIAGRGPDMETLAALIERHDLHPSVRLAGFVPTAQVPLLYDAAEIFLHPQIALEGNRDFEGFGIAVADAMIANTAVVIGREGASPELVEDGVSGVIVDGRDPRAIADALVRLLTDPSARESMAAAGHERASRLFRWDRHVEAILQAVGHSADRGL